MLHSTEVCMPSNLLLYLILHEQKLMAQVLWRLTNLLVPFTRPHLLTALLSFVKLTKYFHYFCPVLRVKASISTNITYILRCLNTFYRSDNYFTLHRNAALSLTTNPWSRERTNHNCQQRISRRTEKFNLLNNHGITNS